MSKGSLITLVVLVVLVLGGMLMYKSVQRAKADAEAPAAPLLLVESLKCYRDNKDYVDGLLREAHAPAFAHAYRSGSLFEPSEWDEQAYVEHVMDYLSRRAQADGKTELVRDLPGVHRKPDDYVEPTLGGGGG